MILALFRRFSLERIDPKMKHEQTVFDLINDTLYQVDKQLSDKFQPSSSCHHRHCEEYGFLDSLNCIRTLSYSLV